MHFYKQDENGKIICAFRTESFETADEDVKKEYLFTEREIIETNYNGYMFKDEIDWDEENKQKKELEKYQHSLSLQPTFEEKIEAQLMYTALLTNSLLEEK